MPLYPNMEPQEFLDLFRRRKWLVIFSFLFIMLGASIYSVVTPELYKSSTTIMVIPQRVPEDFVRSTVSLRNEERLSTIRQQLLSRSRLLRAAEELSLFGSKRSEMTAETVVEAMRQRVGIDVIRNDTFTISFLHEDRNTAMKGAARLASFFIEENLRAREQQAVGTSQFLEAQLKETKVRLEEQEEKVKKYKMSFMGELPQQIQANLDMLTHYQSMLRTNSEAIRSSEDRKVLLENQIGALQRTLQVRFSADGRSLDTATALYNDLVAKRAQLADLSTRYTDQYPEIVRLKREVARLEKRLMELRQAGPKEEAPDLGPPLNARARQAAIFENEEIRRMRSQVEGLKLEIASLKREGEEIRKNLASIQSRVERSPRREQEMIAITRDYENLRTSYNDLLRKKIEAGISQDLEKRQKGEQFQVLDPANLPEKPFKPNRKLIFAYSFIAACILGFGGAVGLEVLDPTIRGRRDFKLFFDLNILACIPVLQDGRYARKRALRRAAILGGIVSFTAALTMFLVLYGERIRAIMRG